MHACFRVPTSKGSMLEIALVNPARPIKVEDLVDEESIKIFEPFIHEQYLGLVEDMQGMLANIGKYFDDEQRVLFLLVDSITYVDDRFQVEHLVGFDITRRSDGKLGAVPLLLDKTEVLHADDLILCGYSMRVSQSGRLLN